MDVSLLVHHDLVTEVQKLGTHCNSKLPDIEVLCRKEEHSLAPVTFVPSFNVQGELLNKKAAFEARGWRFQSEVTVAQEVLVPPSPGKAGFSLRERVQGSVVKITEEEITVEFGESGMVTWPLAKFPMEAVVITKIPGSSQEISIDRAGDYGLTKTAAWRRMVAKARVIHALGIAAEKVNSIEGYVTGDVVPLQYMVKPQRKIVCQDEVSQKKPLLLLPLTTNVTVVPTKQCFFVKTKVDVSGDGDEVVALGPVFHDPVRAEASKPGIVEFFWAVRRSEKLEDCNMEIAWIQFTAGNGITAPQSKVIIGREAAMQLPCMRSTKALSEGEELVCYFVDDGEKSVKRARCD
jgi:hypothetical protein